VTVYLGDAREVTADLPAESVDCVITSPPYWGLRDFGVPATVWDGDPECRHRWSSLQRGRRRPTGGTCAAISCGGSRTAFQNLPSTGRSGAHEFLFLLYLDDFVQSCPIPG
jgi:hypothetical protein